MAIVTPQYGALLDFSNPLTKGLVAAYAMDEGAGSVVHDLSGYRHNASISAGDPTWIVSPIGPVLDYDGNDRVRTNSYIDAISQSTAHTICFWIRQDAGTRNTFALAHNRGSTDRWCVFILDSASFSVALAMYSGTYKSQRIGYHTRDGSWHFVAFTFDGSSNPIAYYDGVNESSGTQVSSIGSGATTGLYLGYSNDSPLGPTLVYDRALSASEIAQLYADPDAWRRREPRQMLFAGVGGAPPSIVPCPYYARMVG